MKTDNATLLRRYLAKKDDRTTVEDLWNYIERFVVPFRGDFYRDLKQEADVAWRKRQIYDSTAIQACQALSASLHSNLTNPVLRWFDLRFRSDTLARSNAVKRWTEEAAQIAFLELQESNFNLEASELYLDLTSFGTGAIIEDVSDTDKLDFGSIPVRELYFEEDARGQALVLYRRFGWTWVQMVDKFGEENVPKEVKEKAEGPLGAKEKSDVIYCIYPRKGKENNTKAADVKERPIGAKYILEKTKETLGEEGGFYEMPAFITRWRKTTGSQWGHSPAAVCLADVMTLNEWRETMLEAAAKSVDPANLTTERGLIGDLDLNRGGLTTVRDLDALKPYESNAKMDWAVMQMEILQKSIKEAFFADQLELKESPAMTATEVNVRYELMQRLLGPTLGRITNDFLDPLVSRTINILQRTGRLPEIPQEVIDAEGEFDIEYTGPMARSQRRDSAMAIQEWAAVIAQMSEIYPSLKHLPDVEIMGRELATVMGVPPRVINDEKTFAKAVKDEQKKMEQAQTMEMVEQGSKALKNAAGAMPTQ